MIINRYNDRQFKQADGSPAAFGLVENCAVIQGHPRPAALENRMHHNISPDSIGFCSKNEGFFDGSSQKYLVDYFGDMTSMNLSSGDKAKVQGAALPQNANESQNPPSNKRTKIINFEEKIKSMENHLQDS